MKYISSYIKNNVLSYNFVSSVLKVTWGFVYHGIQKEYINHQFPIDFANDFVVDNSINVDIDEVLLDICDANSHDFELENNIIKMANKENIPNVDYERKWFLVFASYVYQNYHKINDVESVMAILVDDFDYPEGTQGLLYYGKREKGNNAKSLLEFLEKYITNELESINKADSII